MGRTITNSNYENLATPTYISRAGDPVDSISGNWNAYYDWMKNSKRKYK